jgi:HNH endonuclease
MRIPDTIEHGHIRSALSEILKQGDESIPKNRKSTKFDISSENKRFPPKYVICIANKYVNHVELSSRFNGGTETNNFLEALGFEIVFKDGTPWDFGVEPEDESKVFEEGAKKYKLHLSIERDSRVSQKAKKKRWKETGYFACDVCGFDFHKVYGKRGYRYIEAHHTIPVSELKKGQKTKLEDIALVCSNCHRMLHKSRPWLSIERLGEFIKQKDSTKLKVQ